MSFLRVAALRSSPSAIFSRSATRAVRRTTSQQCLRIGQQAGRREYASATDAVKKTSDLPWAATATVVTAVGTYIALSPSDGGSHGHDDHHGDHGKGHNEHAEEPNEEAKEEELEAKAADESSEKSESKDSGDKEEDKPSKEEESKEDSKPEEKDSKEEDSKSDEKPKGDTDASEDSAAGKTIVEGASSGEGDDHAKTQRGIAITDTKHSTDPHADPGKSSKGEGTAETAKIKGTVEPDRPQV